jgi:hypothetical protein
MHKLALHLRSIVSHVNAAAQILLQANVLVGFEMIVWEQMLQADELGVRSLSFFGFSTVIKAELSLLPANVRNANQRCFEQCHVAL